MAPGVAPAQTSLIIMRKAALKAAPTAEAVARLTMISTLGSVADRGVVDALGHEKHLGVGASDRAGLDGRADQLDGAGVIARADRGHDFIFFGDRSRLGRVEDDPHARGSGWAAFKEGQGASCDLQVLCGVGVGHGWQGQRGGAQNSERWLGVACEHE